MTKHTVKTLASGEYSCSCGAVWDRDEGDECPNSETPLQLGTRLHADVQEALQNLAVMRQVLGAQTLTDEICAALTQRDQPALAYRQKLAARLRAVGPIGCTFCGSDEHMTAVCPMRNVGEQCCGSCPAGCVIQAVKTMPPAVGEFAVLERAAFEAELRRDGWGDKALARSEANGSYEDWSVRNFWKVWQARAALTAPAPNHSEQVRDGKVLIDSAVVDFLRGRGELHGMHFGDSLPGRPLYWWRAYLPVTAPSAGSQGGGV